VQADEKFMTTRERARSDVLEIRRRGEAIRIA
jgi:hypothetical protein